MRKLFICLMIFFPVLFIGCVGTPPTKEDIIGNWGNPDGAEFNFNADGTFKGKSLPAEYFPFYTSRKDVLRQGVDANGKWKMEQGQGRWQLRLYLEEGDFAQYILLLSRSGDFETGDTWYIFVWEKEEGGNRYEFEKQ